MSDIRKKKRSFCIGMSTVTLVVCFLTLLKSVIDISPIAFLKVGQDQAGAIDITLSSDAPEFFMAGDLNYYKIGPWGDTPATTQENLKADDEEVDHVEVAGFDMLNFDVFSRKLDPFNGKGTWKGFTPRSLFPMSLINP